MGSAPRSSPNNRCAFSLPATPGGQALESGPVASQLKATTTEAIATRKKAAEPLAELRLARNALRRASGAMRRAESRLVSAEADQRRFSRRLAVLVEREEREAARAAGDAERESDELTEEESSSGCDPNYSGCVPLYPPDADCDEVGETVSVIGSDPHGLDADGDLVGCE